MEESVRVTEKWDLSIKKEGVLSQVSAQNSMFRLGRTNKQKLLKTQGKINLIEFFKRGNESQEYSACNHEAFIVSTMCCEATGRTSESVGYGGILKSRILA